MLAIKALMPRMPKPVDTPPQLLVIPADEREQESILAWALGLDLAGTEEAQAAIQALDGIELDNLRQLAEAGVLTLRVADTYAPERASDAHARLEAGGTRGRLVIEF